MSSARLRSQRSSAVSLRSVSGGASVVMSTTYPDGARVHAPPGSGGSGPRTRLVRVVERDAHHGGRDALLVAVELADLHLRADVGVLHRHPAERDVLAQDGAAGAARDDADLVAPHVHAIAVARGLVAGELQADEPPLRVGLALHQ